MSGVRRDRSGDGRPSGSDAELKAAISERVASLTLEEKISLLTAPDFSRLRPLPKIGLKEMVVSDGPAGVRGRYWDERDPAQSIPCPAALGATWDEEVVERMGRIMGRDARDKGIDVVLAPCVNLQRSLYAGRHFEYFSEDPLLSGRLGAANVRGIQQLGVAATVKHFVANDSETERMSVDVIVEERALRELYTLPFEIMVCEADPWVVMSSYNLVNGESMSESRLLQDVLKDEWGFRGLVMSDFLAANPTVAAAASGLDLAMPWPKGGAGPWNKMILDAVRAGELDETTLDEKISRQLWLASCCGVLEGFPGKRHVPRRNKRNEAVDLRVAAASSFVLLRNEDELLPLKADALSSVAIIGPNAAQGRACGGGSAKVYPARVVSPLEGISEALGDTVEVRFAEGVRPYHWHPIARAPWLRQADGDEDGVKIEFLGKDGDVVGTERRNTGEFAWTVQFAPGLDLTNVKWVKATGRIVAQEPGTHSVGLSGVGRYRFSLNGEEAFEVDHQLQFGVDITEGFSFPPQRMCSVDLDRGGDVEFEIVHEVGTFKPGSLLTMFQVRLATPFGDEEEELSRAVAAAESADAAVVVLGNDSSTDAEGVDRRGLRLPGRQDELVRRVAAANPSTVVVLNSASPVLMPWADEVSAVLLVWLPGQEFGNALADVLLGEQEPGGRLPVTWPRDESSVLPVEPSGGKLQYSEGIFMGYRGCGRSETGPHYEFGHGLGYTTWDYAELKVPDRATAAKDGLEVVVRVRNMGQRQGREVVQLYLSKPDSGVERPRRWLAGFASVTVAPGEEAALTIAVPQVALGHWTSDGWEIEEGTYVVSVGRSSRDLRLSEEVELAG